MKLQFRITMKHLFATILSFCTVAMFWLDAGPVPSVYAEPIMAQVQGGRGVAAVLKPDGTVWTWGDPIRGQLGTNRPELRSMPNQIEGFFDIVSISVGDYHTLAVKNDGTVWAWGENDFGQLGDGTNIDRYTPVQVKGIEGAVAVAAGTRHSLALLADGTVVGWGDNSRGQLGTGKIESSMVPIQVIDSNGDKPLSGIKSISAGGTHSLALTDKSVLFGWGDNFYGQLGRKSEQNYYNRPWPIYDYVVQAIAGGDFTVFLLQNGMVYTVGNNYYGQLGLGFQYAKSENEPYNITSLKDVVQIAAGNSHVLALKKDGTLWSWGNNTYGQLGYGTTTDGFVPAQIPDLTDVVSISAGSYNSMIVKKDNTLWMWGSNVYGQLGDGTYTNQIKPMQVPGFSMLPGYIKAQDQDDEQKLVTTMSEKPIASGKNSGYVLKNGQLWGWGDNRLGQLGSADAFSSNGPLWAAGVRDGLAVAGGSSHALLLKNDGTVWSWGSNQYGQLGNGTTNNESTPIPIPNLTKAAFISAGNNHSLVLKQNGTVWAFGDNTYGQLGSPLSTQALKPVKVVGLPEMQTVSAGYNHSLALGKDGTVWAWGDNSNGQLGDGTYATKRMPSKIADLSEIVAIAAGKNHSLAVKSDGTVWSWGYNTFGQLGDGTVSNQISPVQIKELSDIVDVAAGDYHSYALKRDGTVWSWGYNAFGQLGDGSTANKNLPAQIKALSDVSTISAGSNFGLAMKKDGTVWSWGANYFRQLGIESQDNQKIPVQINGFVKRFSDLDGHWAKDAINRALEKNYVDGYDDGTFRPDLNVTRAEFVKMLVSALVLSLKSNNDNEVWYLPYTNAASAAGILPQGITPDDSWWNGFATRQDIAEIAVRAVKSELQEENALIDHSFILYTAVKLGLLHGVDNGALSPEDPANRAQSVMIIDRILALKNGETLEVDSQALHQAEALQK